MSLIISVYMGFNINTNRNVNYILHINKIPSVNINAGKILTAAAYAPAAMATATPAPTAHSLIKKISGKNLYQ